MRSVGLRRYFKGFPDNKDNQNVLIIASLKQFSQNLFYPFHLFQRSHDHLGMKLPRRQLTIQVLTIFPLFHLPSFFFLLFTVSALFSNLSVSNSFPPPTVHSHRSGILGQGGDNDLQWVSSFPSRST